MIENSGFEQEEDRPGAAQSFRLIPLSEGKGATCRTFKTRIYGKWHFVKQLDDTHPDSQRLEAAFRKEVEIGYGFDHPNLPRYQMMEGVFPAGKYIVTEWINGFTLEEFLTSETGYFTVKENILKFVEEFADVLEYLHSLQILHLDIKPSNVMITRVGHSLKLIDFGFCTTDADLDTRGKTEGYMAPEREGRGNDPDVGADYYSLGCILKYIREHTDGFPSRYTSRLERGLLASSPSKRISSKSETVKALRRRGWKVMAIIAVCVILLAFSWFLWSIFTEDPDGPKTVYQENKANEGVTLPEKDPTVTVSDFSKEISEISIEGEDVHKPERLDSKADKIKSPGSSGLSRRDEIQAIPFAGENDLKATLNAIRKEMMDHEETRYKPFNDLIAQYIKEQKFSRDDQKYLEEKLKGLKSVHIDISLYKARYPQISEDVILEIFADVDMKVSGATESGLWKTYCRQVKAAYP